VVEGKRAFDTQILEGTTRKKNVRDIDNFFARGKGKKGGNEWVPRTTPKNWVGRRSQGLRTRWIRPIRPVCAANAKRGRKEKKKKGHKEDRLLGQKRKRQNQTQPRPVEKATGNNDPNQGPGNEKSK